VRLRPVAVVLLRATPLPPPCYAGNSSTHLGNSVTTNHCHRRPLQPSGPSRPVGLLCQRATGSLWRARASPLGLARSGDCALVVLAVEVSLSVRHLRLASLGVGSLRFACACQRLPRRAMLALAGATVGSPVK
jgi:hypothetical protein